MKLHSFEDLFLALLSDIYIVENQIVKDIPLLVERAQSEELKKALHTHLAETKEQVKRLDKVFKIVNHAHKRVEWANDVKALFVDVGAFLKENASSPLLDAAIIVIAQRIEHFEIATYGTLLEFAEVLGYHAVKDILKATIKEEGHADRVLTKLAEGGFFSKGINVEATR